MGLGVERDEASLEDETGVLEIGFETPEAAMSLKEFEVRLYTYNCVVLSAHSRRDLIQRV